MVKVLAICIIVCLAVPVFADELQELNQKRNMINVAIIQAQGVAEMNEQQIYLKTAQNVVEVISSSNYDGDANEEPAEQIYTVIKSETQPNVSNFVQISSEPSVLPESKNHSNVTDMTSDILPSATTQSISVADNSVEASTSNVEIQGPSNDTSIVLNSDGQTILPSSAQRIFLFLSAESQNTDFA